ncbi:hypothetical protein KFK09_029012 [Dendrobium nobile]|uniref:Uncharacterized protein n=1 Tax=Dendrobium nobile TaxID=94219 RepID=A0A8T3A578_DENNO|nr:hypothetical protein KFK09_029012 [Dendrobium nobile]
MPGAAPTNLLGDSVGIFIYHPQHFKYCTMNPHAYESVQAAQSSVTLKATRDGKGRILALSS